ncbi:MAG: ATP-binding protein [Acidimicrobiia bacterium]|nr:ATP-binding protein [Acidimicrobiia bacterium]MYB23807.1 ATP-binding protein [Acidimicrobiia bacterium]MYJ12813.1 ATP-binding protein [Acidimicrobiia bacterium]
MPDAAPKRAGELSAQFRLEVGATQNESVDDALRRIEASLDEFSSLEHCPADLAFKLHLIIEELALNAMTYGGAESVQITITAEAEAVTVEISDDGDAFDPLNDAPEPDLDAALEDRAVGGLGIHLVRTLTDDLSYRWDGERNYLTLVTRQAE